MKIIVSNTVTIQATPPSFMKVLIDRLTIENPKWVENERIGRWNGETPRLLKFYKETSDGDLMIPRGFTRQLIGLCKHHAVQFHIDDHRRLLSEVSFDFNGQLKPFQEETVEAIEEYLKRRQK